MRNPVACPVTPRAMTLVLLSCCVPLWSLLLTPQVQLCQCCVCLESIAQSTRSFSTNLVVCPVTPRAMTLVLLSCCVSLWSCCLPSRSSFVSVVFVLSASPSPRAPSTPIPLSAQSHHMSLCLHCSLAVFPCGLVAHSTGSALSPAHESAASVPTHPHHPVQCLSLWLL